MKRVAASTLLSRPAMDQDDKKQKLREEDRKNVLRNIKEQKLKLKAMTDALWRDPAELKRTLDLFTIRLLRTVAAQCRARAAGGFLRAEAI